LTNSSTIDLPEVDIADMQVDIETDMQPDMASDMPVEISPVEAPPVRVTQNQSGGWWALSWPLWGKDIQLSYLRLWEQPILTWLTCCVIGLSLALPFGLYLLVSQLMAFSNSWQAENQMTLYLHPTVSFHEADALASRVRAMPDIMGVELVTKEHGLTSFVEGTGLGETLAHLDDNPLPHVLVVMPNTMDERVLGPLHQRLANFAEVESAQLDLQWLQKLNAVLGLGSRVVAALAFGFSLAVLLVVYNTIRFALEHRIREIEILRQLGASTYFIARPYLLSGVWLGLIGGVLALLLVQGVYYWLQYSIGLVTALYAGAGISSLSASSGLQEGVTLLASVELVATAMLLGLFSAALALFFELRRD